MAADDDSSPTPRVVEECRGVLRVYSDGSVSRSPGPSFPVPVRDDGSVEWRDALFDPATASTSASTSPAAAPRGQAPRLLLLPRRRLLHRLPHLAQLPELLPPPRLRPRRPRRRPRLPPRPEDPLPAALLDAAAALAWLRSADDDPWLASSGADLARVVVSGDSAGGNIATTSPSADPVRVGVPGRRVPERDLNDRYWRLALPAGFGLDHPTVNPFGPESPSSSRSSSSPCWSWSGEGSVEGPGADYAARLSRMGKPVELVEFEGQQHGFFTIDPGPNHPTSSCGGSSGSSRSVAPGPAEPGSDWVVRWTVSFHCWEN
uniref:Alpha/beta hydrolase fold-3 domain-containing protein n=1 Tax=Ananas comosus var. bracteatus TaxID=296719 RepID=A0A6V7NM92_ANACO|nr:unnamed protein product [Ananas comosus var. bracteatus]